MHVENQKGNLSTHSIDMYSAPPINRVLAAHGAEMNANPVTNKHSFLILNYIEDLYLKLLIFNYFSGFKLLLKKPLLNCSVLSFFLFCTTLLDIIIGHCRILFCSHFICSADIYWAATLGHTVHYLPYKGKQVNQDLCLHRTCSQVWEIVKINFC